MAGSFLSGLGRNIRATTVGALEGRRQALDRAEEQRRQREAEARADMQNQLVQQLRQLQTDQFALQKEQHEQAQRDRQGNVDAFIIEFPELEEFRDNPSLVLARGTVLREQRALEDERAQRMAEIQTPRVSLTGQADESEGDPTTRRQILAERRRYVQNKLDETAGGVTPERVRQFEREAAMIYRMPGENLPEPEQPVRPNREEVDQARAGVASAVGDDALEQADLRIRQYAASIFRGEPDPQLRAFVSQEALRDASAERLRAIFRDIIDRRRNVPPHLAGMTVDQIVEQFLGPVATNPDATNPSDTLSRVTGGSRNLR